ncbi:MAG: asparagine synthase (glutamine-hydrolyzing) [Thermoleophilaceae bacterium]|nr:asparagine synthase (glutamine-hydrolyzing) [Thermoleophilaceae bacterium]
MCGIAGVYAPGATASADLVREMTARLAHRGPDGEGYHAEPELALGMRRLAIVDPEHGHQPIYDERREIAVVFNGEIYNYAELRRWLEQRGHRMRSGSDGEVLPHLYEELGDAFVERLNGIFAIALWDPRERALLLARDKLGVKPLYWSEAGGRVSFASEIKGLLADPALPRELDPVAVDEFLTYRFVPSPRTLLSAVRKLPPAGRLRVDARGLSEERYWHGEAFAARRDREQLVEEYLEAFERAVVRQLMSDRPMGVMLSGGLDSAAVTAVMAKHLPKVRSFTVGFSGGGPETNEVEAAAQTARLFGAEHEHVVVGAEEYLARLPEALVALEEPVAATSAPAVRFVAELMRPRVPVALSGQGADEPLAGYGRHFGVDLAGRLRRLGPLPRLAARLAGRTGSQQLRRGLESLAARGDTELLMTAYQVLSPQMKARVYTPELAAALRGARPERALERLRGRVADRDPLTQVLYVDTRLSLPDELLMIADKMSMAESVELRVPFLDEDLVALVESMHPRVKLRGREGKSIHKQAMLRLLPREIVERRKVGWETPLDRWLRRELRPLLDDVLLGDGGLCAELFDRAALRDLIEEHAVGRHDRTRELFCLLSLGLWHRAFVEDPVPAARAAA